MGSREEDLENLKKFWPENAPNISQVPKYVSKYKKEKIVIKCGGKVLIEQIKSPNQQQAMEVLKEIHLPL